MSSHGKSSLDNLLGGSCCFLLLSSAEAFSGLYRPSTFVSQPSWKNGIHRPNKGATTFLRMIYAPPGSGWARPEDEKSVFPDTYEPMMEYPGTMRPGRTPENMPFQDLPIGDDDPDPVPWPHFQQIEWHHKWDPPHPHPIPMEEYIDLNGRWATPEMEAKMRAGVRRDVRERQEKAAAEKKDWVITDDDEDDINDEPISLGDGVFGQLGSDADAAITAEATRPRAEGEDEEEGEDEDEGTEEDDLDNFLLDLGLDADVDMEDTFGGGGGGSDDASTKRKKSAPPPEEDLDDPPRLDLLSDSGGDISATINVGDDDDLDLGLDDDDELGPGDDGVSTVPLEDFGDDNDTLAGEDIFDDGGFDYDAGDFDGGDVW